MATVIGDEGAEREARILGDEIAYVEVEVVGGAATVVRKSAGVLVEVFDADVGARDVYDADSEFGLLEEAAV